MLVGISGPSPGMQSQSYECLERGVCYPVGFFDHPPYWNIALAAVAQGACVIEKHFTLDNIMEGPDHKASLNADYFSQMGYQIREVEQSMGNEQKPSPLGEKEAKKLSKNL